MENLDLTNIYFIVSLGASLIILLLAFFVLSKNPSAPVNKFFAAFAFCISLWTFGNALDAAALRPEISQLWREIGGIGGLLIGPMFLLFIFAFTKNYRLLNNFFTHIFLLGLSLFLYSWLAFLYPTPLEELIKMPWGWEAKGPRDIIAIFGEYFWVPLLMAIGLGFCWQFRQKTKDPLEKKQASFIIIATTTPLALFLLTGFALPRLNISQEIIGLSKVLFGLSSLVLVGPLAYAALKYRLFVLLTPAATADTIIETMKDALAVASPNLKIDFLNSSISQILDYRKDELIGQSLEIIFSPLDWQELREKAIKRIEKKESPPALETNLLSKRGKLIPVSLSTSALKDKEGNLIGIVILAKDIRETRELIRKIQEKSSELAEKVKELEIAGQEAKKTRLATLNILEDVEEARLALQERVEELEKFNKLAVGRELKMVELKEEIQRLNKELEEK
jgi:PAS domain S-box-containing protein